jgi:hypothetical protein
MACAFLVDHCAPMLSGARSMPSDGLTLTLNFPLRVSEIRVATSPHAGWFENVLRR